MPASSTLQMMGVRKRKVFTTSGARMLGPEKWRTISAQAEVIGNFDGRSQRF